MNPSDLLISFSLALYSQWFYYKPSRCLFDAGEGVATTLGKKVFAIQNVFLSHGHEDHIAGIANLVNVRNIAPGDKDKPLNLYYPRHDRWVNELLAYIEKKQSGLIQFPLFAQPLEPGDEVVLEGAHRPTRVIAFSMKHMAGQLALGYEIEEERKLVDEASGKTVQRYHPVFLYTGDGYDLAHRPYGRVDMAVHEATFLARDAAKAGAWETARHSTMEGALDWAASADVKTLVLCHISDRYRIEEAVREAAATKARTGFRGDLYIAHRDRIIEVGDD